MPIRIPLPVSLPALRSQHRQYSPLACFCATVTSHHDSCTSLNTHHPPRNICSMQPSSWEQPDLQSWEDSVVMAQKLKHLRRHEWRQWGKSSNQLQWLWFQNPKTYAPKIPSASQLAQWSYGPVHLSRHIHVTLQVKTPESAAFLTSLLRLGKSSGADRQRA